MSVVLPAVESRWVNPSRPELGVYTVAGYRPSDRPHRPSVVLCRRLDRDVVIPARAFGQPSGQLVPAPEGEVA